MRIYTTYMIINPVVPLWHQMLVKSRRITYIVSYNGEYRTPVNADANNSVSTDRLMDVDFNQADTLIYNSSSWKPKTRTVSCAKLTWKR
jgi:hypothetical protein